METDDAAANAGADAPDIYQATQEDEHTAAADTVLVDIEVVAGNFNYVKPEHDVKPWEVTASGVSLITKDHKLAVIRYLTESANNYLEGCEEAHGGVVDRVVWSSGRRRDPPWNFTMHIQPSQPVAKVAESLMTTKFYIPCSFVNGEGLKGVEELGFRVQKTKIRDQLSAHVEKQRWTLQFRTFASRFAVVKDIYDRIHHLAFPVNMFEISDDRAAYRVLPPWSVSWTYEMSWDPIRAEMKRGRSLPTTHLACADTISTPRLCSTASTATLGPA